MPAAIDLCGQRFGRLVVIDRAGKDAHRHALWRCQCACGQFKNVPFNRLWRGATKSCGCLMIEAARAHALSLSTHGAAGHGQGRRWPEYYSWASMKARCLNPKNNRYKHYGARGITVCARWINSFENFLADMGRKPGPEYSLDRIDNDGNYEPGNCRWATRSQQMSNQRRQDHARNPLSGL